MGRNVMGAALGLGRGEEAPVRRHAGTLLLREARVAAALALWRPVSPKAALDALAEAVQSDPDVVEGAAILGPWPQPTTSLGPLGMERGLIWRAWCSAGAAAHEMREQWDEDFVMRKVFQEAVRSMLTAAETQGDHVLTQVNAKDAAPDRLVRWFEGCL
jgi:hypothetical protein